MNWNMAAGTDCSPPFTLLDSGYVKENAPEVKDELSENSNDSKQTPCGKPPRHLSVVRHSISTATLQQASDVVSKFLIS